MIGIELPIAAGGDRQKSNPKRSFGGQKYAIHGYRKARQFSNQTPKPTKLFPIGLRSSLRDGILILLALGAQRDLP